MIHIVQCAPDCSDFHIGQNGTLKMGSYALAHRACTRSMEVWPPCKVVGQNVDHNSHQKHQSANPEERRMMNALPITLAANRGLWRASLIIFLIHMRHSIVS